MSTDSKYILSNATFQSNDAVLEPFSVIPNDVTSVIRKHSRSFSMAARWLPADVRGDVEKLYAWCRWCDEAVDSASDQQDAIARLAILREDVRRVFDGQEVQHPASQWLADLVKTKGIRETEAFDLLAGMEMDLHLGQVDDEEALLRYCYCVAGVVGLMMCRVMGVQSQSAEKHAIDLGMAMQLTNIVRDVAEDWKRGRSYLPKTWIPVDLPTVCFEPSRADVLIKSPSNAAVRESVHRLLAMAEVRYSSGLRGVAMLPQGCRPAIELAAKLYREIGREVLRQEGRVMDGRIAVPRLRMICVAGSALIRSLFNHVAGVRCVAGVRHRKTMSGPSANLRSRAHIVSRGRWLGISSFFTNDKGLQKMVVSKKQKMNDAKYLAYLGVSLTSFMASALFVLVSINPKDPSYAALPILYAIVCVGIGIAANVMARKAAVRQE